MRTFLLQLIPFLLVAGSVQAQRTLTLEECRTLAMRNNRQLLAAAEQKEAEWEHKAAQTSRLPKLSADGSYIFNARTTRLISKKQHHALENLGTDNAAQIAQTAQSIVQQFPDLAPLVQSLGNGIVPGLNQIGTNLSHALETHTRNIFVGALVLTQPIYMGGRLRAYDV